MCTIGFEPLSEEMIEYLRTEILHYLNSFLSWSIFFFISEKSETLLFLAEGFKV